MNDPIKDSLEAARAAAASNPASTAPYVPGNPGQVPSGGAPTVYQPKPGDIVQHQPKGHKLSVSTMTMTGGNSQNVDNFIKGSEKHGLVVNFAKDDPRRAQLGNLALQPIVLLVDYSTDVLPKYSLRVNVANSVKFYHSFDRVYMSDGVTPWDQMVNQAKSRDTNCKGDYPSVDFSGTLIEPLRTQSGIEVLPAGKRVGFSTSVMNWKEYEQMHAALVAADLVEEYDDNSMEGKVVVRVGHYVKTNRGGIDYGAFTFECLGDGKQVVVPTAPAGASAPQQTQPVQAAPAAAHNTGAYNPGGQPAQTTAPAQPSQPAAPAAAAEGQPSGGGQFFAGMQAKTGAATSAPAQGTSQPGFGAAPATPAGVIPGVAGAPADAPKQRKNRKVASAEGQQ